MEGLWLLLEMFDDFSYPGFAFADLNVQAAIIWWDRLWLVVENEGILG